MDTNFPLHSFWLNCSSSLFDLLTLEGKVLYIKLRCISFWFYSPHHWKHFPSDLYKSQEKWRQIYCGRSQLHDNCSKSSTLTHLHNMQSPLNRLFKMPKIGSILVIFVWEKSCRIDFILLLMCDFSLVIKIDSTVEDGLKVLVLTRIHSVRLVWAATKAAQ